MRMKQKQKGFTLVELLVVISIIALLLSILMPSLGRAREAARAVVCKVNMRQIGLASTLYSDNNENWIAPAVGPYVARTPIVDRYWYSKFIPYVSKDMTKKGKLFNCPSDKKPREVLRDMPGDPTYYYLSYSYPDYFGDMGRDGWDLPGSPWALTKRIRLRRPSEVVILLDANHHDDAPWSYAHQELMTFQIAAWGGRIGWYCVPGVSPYPGNEVPWTWAAWRHNDQSNAVLMDGHVETFSPSSQIAHSYWNSSKKTMAVKRP